jgi:hypothetical protein
MYQNVEQIVFFDDAVIGASTTATTTTNLVPNEPVPAFENEA